MAYALINPIPDIERIELGLARMMALTAEINRNETLRIRPFTVLDFMPKWAEAVDQPPPRPITSNDVRLAFGLPLKSETAPADKEGP